MMLRIPHIPPLPCMLLLFALPGCASKRTVNDGGSPLPTTAPSGWRIPSGCDVNLSGDYVHATSPNHRYRAVDAPPTLRLSLVGTAANGAEGSPVEIVVTRSATGFRGVVTGAQAEAGVSCPLQFPVEILSCTGTGLSLKSLPALDFDDTCQLVSPPSAREQWVVHELRRVSP